MIKYVVFTLMISTYAFLLLCIYALSYAAFSSAIDTYGAFKTHNSFQTNLVYMYSYLRASAKISNLKRKLFVGIKL